MLPRHAPARQEVELSVVQGPGSTCWGRLSPRRGAPEQGGGGGESAQTPCGLALELAAASPRRSKEVDHVGGGFRPAVRHVRFSHGGVMIGGHCCRGGAAYCASLPGVVKEKVPSRSSRRWRASGVRKCFRPRRAALLCRRPRLSREGERRAVQRWVSRGTLAHQEVDPVRDRGCIPRRRPTLASSRDSTTRAGTTLPTTWAARARRNAAPRYAADSVPRGLLDVTSVGMAPSRGILHVLLLV
jgi:hypothetical protein